jgi:hypothetical protein
MKDDSNRSGSSATRICCPINITIGFEGEALIGGNREIIAVNGWEFLLMHPCLN